MAGQAAEGRGPRRGGGQDRPRRGQPPPPACAGLRWPPRRPSRPRHHHQRAGLARRGGEREGGRGRKAVNGGRPAPRPAARRPWARRGPSGDEGGRVRPGVHAPLIFSTRAVVEWPGERWTRSTRPPAASTSSRPTTASRAQFAPFTSTSGSERGDDRERRRFVVDEYAVDRLQREQHFGPLRLRDHRAGPRPSGADGGVGVHGHQEQVALRASGLEEGARGPGAAGRSSRW